MVNADHIKERKTLDLELEKQFKYEENDHSCLVTHSGRKVGYLSELSAAKGMYNWKTMYKSKSLYVHRIIWEVVHGKIPENMVINHIDNEPSNNRLANLEICTMAENNRRAITHTGNKGGLRKDNTSGHNGVCLITTDGYSFSAARWTEGGKLKYKLFSHLKHGSELAEQLAIAYRQEMIMQLNLKGYGYTQSV